MPRPLLLPRPTRGPWRSVAERRLGLIEPALWPCGWQPSGLWKSVITSESTNWFHLAGNWRRACRASPSSAHGRACRGHRTCGLSDRRHQLRSCLLLAGGERHSTAASVWLPAVGQRPAVSRTRRRREVGAEAVRGVHCPCQLGRNLWRRGFEGFAPRRELVESISRRGYHQGKPTDPRQPGLLDGDSYGTPWHG